MAVRNLASLTAMAKDEISKEQERFERRLEKRRAKKLLRQRAAELVEAVDDVQNTMTERDIMLRPGISAMLDARDGLAAALDGKLKEPS